MQARRCGASAAVSREVIYGPESPAGSMDREENRLRERMQGKTFV